MKKNYLLSVLFAFAIISVNAQFEDDMESYSDGDPIIGAHWTDWGCGGGPGCAIMSSSVQVHGGSLSGLVPDDATTDAVLDLGDKIFGQWGLLFYMYIESNQEGYFNLQGTVPVDAGEWIVGNIYFNQDLVTPGEGVIDDAVGAPVIFNFPHDEWFPVIINVDISLGISLATWQFQVDGLDVVPAGTAFTTAAGTVPTSFGGIDFWSSAVTCLYYVDDFSFIEGVQTLDTNDSEINNFSAFPNPVKDVLNLTAKENITSVAIYNVLGQNVYNAQVDALQTVVDMSTFQNGTYFVKVSVNGTEGTIKILK